MFKNLMIASAIIIGLCFLSVHILYVYQFFPPEKLDTINVSFWRIFLIFFMFSACYSLISLLMILFNRTTASLTGFYPILINVIIFILICMVSLLHG